MSFRGSFCTEYVDCPKCFEQAKKVLLGNEKYLASTTIPAWKGSSDIELPIIAGKVGSLHAGGEFSEMEELFTVLEKTLCHPLRVVVISETDGEKTYTIKNDQT
jgi:hypothetical protein